MLGKILKCCSVVALLAMIILHLSAGYALMTQFLVCAAAIMATVESFQSGNPVPAVVFVVLAIAFNPVLPLGMSRGLFLGTATIALGMFMVSILTFRPQPRLSMASITDRTPGSVSL